MFKKYNPNRRPTDKQLAQTQTQDLPNIVQLQTEFADHPSSGMTPVKLAAILRDAEHGNLLNQCNLAEDLEEKDSHLFAELFKRKMALTTVDWEIQPPRNASAQEQKDAANIHDILRDVEKWNGVLFNMADGILKGFSNTEYVFERYNQFYIPDAFEHRPSTWFQVSPTNQNKLHLRDNTAEGQPLNSLGWIQHRHAAKSGYISRGGLVRQLAWPFLFKNYSVRDFAEFLEIYGLPIRIGRYPTGASQQEKKRLMQAVMSVGHNAGGIMPKGMEMEFHDAAKGAGDPFMNMVSWAERSMSKAIVGQTLTAEQGKTGSQALGNVHNEIRMDIRDHDLGQLADTLNRDLIQPLYVLNGRFSGDVRRMPRIVFDTQEPEDLKLYSEAVPKLVQTGMQIPASYVHEKLRIPEPEAGEHVLGQLPAQTTHNAATTASVALRDSHNHSHDIDVADHYAAQLQSAMSASFDQAFLEPIFELMAGSDSYDEFLSGLTALEGQLSKRQFTTLMHQALAAAELAGRYEVSRGE